MDAVRGTVPQNAQALLDKHFQGEYPSKDGASRPVTGIAPTAQAFVICGECSDDGGGSSGQCACDKS